MLFVLSGLKDLKGLGLLTGRDCLNVGVLFCFVFEAVTVVSSLIHGFIISVGVAAGVFLA